MPHQLICCSHCHRPRRSLRSSPPHHHRHLHHHIPRCLRSSGVCSNIIIIPHHVVVWWWWNLLPINAIHFLSLSPHKLCLINSSVPKKGLSYPPPPTTIIFTLRLMPIQRCDANYCVNAVSEQHANARHTTQPVLGGAHGITQLIDRICSLNFPRRRLSGEFFLDC